MLKKIIAITSLVLTLMLGLSLVSCKKADDVIESYKKAVELKNYFTLSSLSTDSEISGTYGDRDYYHKVTDKRFPTYKALSDYTYSLFSKEIADELLKSDLYVDIDGQLFGLDADRGADIYKGAETYTVENVSDTKINFIVEVEIFGDDLKTVVGTEKFNFVYEKIADQWVFTEFPTIR